MLIPVELSVPGGHCSSTRQSGAVTKAGRGTLALSGNNTYTGATTVTVDGGTLAGQHAGHRGRAALHGQSWRHLGGTGTITGTVTLAAVGNNLTFGGILDPGPNAAAPRNTGILTVNNNVTFNAGSLVPSRRSTARLPARSTISSSVGGTGHRHHYRAQPLPTPDQHGDDRRHDRLFAAQHTTRSR